MRKAPQPDASSPRIWHHPHCWELRSANHSHACYREHLHDTVSIGRVTRGRSRCHLERHTHLLQAGDFVYIRPYEPHRCNPQKNAPWSYEMLHLDTAWLMQLGIDLPACSAAFPAQNTFLLQRCFQRWMALAKAHNDLLEIESNTVALFHALPSLLDGSAATTRKEVSLKKTIDRLKAHACDTINLTQLANDARLSPWQLLRAFKQSTGTTPHAFQQSLRIQQARRWVAQGMPLAEAAQHAGFTDQSHFTSVFKRHTALTPGRYQRAGSRQ